MNFQSAVTGALNDASGFWHALPQLVAQQVGNFGIFRVVSSFSELWHIWHHVMARVAVLAVLMMQALAEQSCQEESQEESSTLMQLNHGDLDQELLQTP